MQHIFSIKERSESLKFSPIESNIKAQIQSKISKKNFRII